MTDHITTQEFHNHFAYIMDGLVTISLKRWFDTRLKNEVLLEMVQYLQTNNEAEKFNRFEKYNSNLVDKIQSILQH